MVKTYDPKKVLIACGTHSVTGLADDAFVSVEPAGEGVTKKVGCDGEIVRSNQPRQDLDGEDHPAPDKRQQLLSPADV